MEILREVDVSTLRARRTTNLVFVCGGALPIAGSQSACSVRDILIERLHSENLSDKTIIAERAIKEFDDKIYDDLISFEADIANVCSSIIVIVESPGSIAELGAFAMHEKYNKKLRVLTHETHFSENSFIRLGPLKFLENLTDRLTIYHDVSDPTTVSRSSIAGLDDIWLMEIVEGIRGDIEIQHDTEKYSPGNDFHQMMTILFIAWVLLAARKTEIVDTLVHFGIDIKRSRVDQLLAGLSLSGLIVEVPLGSDRYFVPRIDAPPLDFMFHPGSRAPRDKLRLRATVSEYYQRKKDKRLRAVGKAYANGATA